jgi:hypothetical protein
VLLTLLQLADEAGADIEIARAHGLADALGRVRGARPSAVVIGRSGVRHSSWNGRSVRSSMMPASCRSDAVSSTLPAHQSDRSCSSEASSLSAVARALARGSRVVAQQTTSATALEILHVDAERAGELGHGVERAGFLAGLDLAQIGGRDPRPGPRARGRSGRGARAKRAGTSPSGAW